MANIAVSNKAVVNGATIHYVTWGQPRHPPVVLQHGLRAYGEWFAPLGTSLADRYYVVAPDLRGRNLSDWAKDGDYSIDAHVGDLAALTQLLGFSRFALAGHSLGGAIAASFATSHPDKVAALVLLDASPEPEPNGITRIKDEVARTPATFPSWNAASDFLRTLHPRAPSDHFATRLRCMLAESDDGTLRWRIDRACTRPTLDPPETAWTALRGIKCPTLHLRGTESDILGPQTCAKMVAATPGSRAVEIAGAAHMLIEDNPAATVAATASFLAEHYPAR
jgi:pimeloyl-ACP methyl ester carboxylesterase